jgi:type I restriction enzyme, S subunit
VISQPRRRRSGLAWAPWIPDHWTVKKLSYLASLKSGDSITSDDIRDDGPYPVYGGNGLRGYTDRFTHDGEYPLIGRQGALCGNINYAKGQFWASEHAVVVAPREEVAVRWLGELLRAMELNQYSASAAQPGLSVDTIAALRVPIPPFREQCVIADYLDRETARLDALVAVKERVLGLLAEKRRALITRAVTRGLDPRAALRDSGIPWLGSIPADWETRRAAWLFRERDERGEADLPLLEVSISAGVILREFSDERIESTAADFNNYKVARQGDVAFNKMRMWQGAVGVAPQDGLVSPDYVVAAPTGLLTSAYAALLFRTEMFSAECARRSHGIVWDRLRLYWDGFREIELPLPSEDAQRTIVSYVAAETAKIDALRLASERSIALLRERRVALIAAAVTGQLSLPGTA